MAWITTLEMFDTIRLEDGRVVALTYRNGTEAVLYDLAAGTFEAVPDLSRRSYCKTGSLYDRLSSREREELTRLGVLASITES